VDALCTFPRTQQHPSYSRPLLLCAVTCLQVQCSVGLWLEDDGVETQLQLLDRLQRDDGDEQPEARKRQPQKQYCVVCGCADSAGSWLTGAVGLLQHRLLSCCTHAAVGSCFVVLCCSEASTTDTSLQQEIRVSCNLAWWSCRCADLCTAVSVTSRHLSTMRDHQVPIRGTGTTSKTMSESQVCRL
jgi:hypothetical protein